MSFGSPYILTAHHSHTLWAPPDLHQRTSESTGSISCRHAFHIPQVFGSHASGRPPYPGAAHARQQSPHVPTPQCGSSHTFAPFPHTLRRLPHLSIPWRNSPCKCQIPHRASKLHKIPHRTRRDQRSVHSNLRIQPAYADSLQQRGWLWQCAGRGTTWHGHDHGSVTTPARRHVRSRAPTRRDQRPVHPDSLRRGPCVGVTTASTSWGATACYGRA